MNDSNIPPRRGQIRSNPRTLQSVRATAPLPPPEVVFTVSEKTRKDLSKAAAKAMLLSRAIQAKQPVKEKRKVDPRQIAFIILALLLLAAICYIGFDTWRINNRDQATNEVTTSANISADDRQSQEGTDRNPLPRNALDDYKVAAELPRALYINKIGVAARVLPMSLNSDNSIQAPINIFDSGWYTGSVKPGEDGAMLIDGHSTTDRRALFGKLDMLAIGDTVELEKGDGAKLTYKVVYKETVDKDAVDMKKALRPYGNAQRALNLITCSGAWNDAENTLAKRTLVYTEQI